MPSWPFDSPETAVLIFAATQIVTLLGIVASSVVRRRRLIVGLYEEIVLNLKAIDAFLAQSDEAPPDMLRYVRTDRRYRPHIIYAQQTRFFESNLKELSAVSRELNRLMVDFYSDLESLEIEIQAIQYASFATVKNRENVIKRIWTTTRQAKLSGEIARSYVQGKYRRLVRRNRG